MSTHPNMMFLAGFLMASLLAFTWLSLNGARDSRPVAAIPLSSEDMRAALACMEPNSGDPQCYGMDAK